VALRLRGHLEASFVCAREQVQAGCAARNWPESSMRGEVRLSIHLTGRGFPPAWEGWMSIFSKNNQ
jgi:hypothetical protein